MKNLKRFFLAVTMLVSMKSVKMSRILVPLALAFTIFGAAGFTGAGPAFAKTTAACGVQVKATANADDGSTVLGTLSFLVNTCTNKAYGQFVCAIPSSVGIQIFSYTQTESASTNVVPCTAGQTIVEPTLDYQPKGTVLGVFVGNGYFAPNAPSGDAEIFSANF